MSNSMFNNYKESLIEYKNTKKDGRHILRNVTAAHVRKKKILVPGQPYTAYAVSYQQVLRIAVKFKLKI